MTNDKPKIIDIEDAKVFKRWGIPLHTPVERRTIPLKTTKLHVRLFDANGDFWLAMIAYAEKATMLRWKKIKKSLRELGSAMLAMDAHLAQLMKDDDTKMLSGRVCAPPA